MKSSLAWFSLFFLHFCYENKGWIWERWIVTSAEKFLVYEMCKLSRQQLLLLLGGWVINSISEVGTTPSLMLQV